MLTLDLPEPGVTAGPEWASKLNAALTALNEGKLDEAAAAELIRDIMGATLVEGPGVTITPDDAGDTIMISASGGGGSSPFPVFGSTGLVSSMHAYAAGAVGGFAMATNGGSIKTMHAVPFPVERAARLRSWGIRVETAGEAGCVVKVWLYKEGSQGSLPNSLFADLGSVPGDATAGIKNTLGAPLLMEPGVYMFLVGTTAVTTAPSISGWTGNLPVPLRSIDNVNNLGLATRVATVSQGIDPNGAAPATITWDTTTVRLIDSTTARTPAVVLDFIAPA